MSDGISEAYKKVDKKTEAKMDLKYIKAILLELQKAIDALEITLEDK